MRVSVVTRITISASPSEVFAYLSDVKYHYLWNPHTREFRPVTKLKLGSKYSTVNVVLGIKTTAKNTVTKFIQDKELEIRNETGPVEYCVNYQLLPKGKKTQVICDTAAYTESKAFAFTKPVLKALAKRELQTDMQALKLAVEHKLS